MLLPYRLLSRKRNHGAFQKWLVTNTNIEEILYLGPIYEIGANDEFMIGVFSHNPDSRNAVAIALDVTHEQLECRKLRFRHLPQNSCGAPDFTINIRAFLFSQPLLEKIRAC